MTLLVNKQIRKFRLAKNLKQKDIASAMGISERLLSNFEVGVAYPAAKYISKLNELGADIHPSIFSPLAQKLTAAIRKRLVVLKRTDLKHLEGVQISKRERRWINEQIEKKKLYYSDIAEKVGCSRTHVGNVIRGRNKSERVQRGIAEILGYGSFEDLLNAYRQKQKEEDKA
jgi:transcriptional regulator with XRE-family HTH domain